MLKYGYGNGYGLFSKNEVLKKYGYGQFLKSKVRSRYGYGLFLRHGKGAGTGASKIKFLSTGTESVPVPDVRGMVPT